MLICFFQRNPDKGIKRITRRRANLASDIGDWFKSFKVESLKRKG